MASRNAFVPDTGVYLVSPLSRACLQAAFILSGVSKSGSPRLKLIISTPCSFSSRDLRAIANVADSFIFRTLVDNTLMVGSITNSD